MKKQLFMFLTLLMFAVVLAAPTRPVAADGAEHVYFTATTNDLCYPVALDNRCQSGEWVPLPNGKGFLKGWLDIVEFNATDPRWTAECVMTGDDFPPGNLNSYPLMGSFVCTPTDPAYAGGWWEGTLTQVAQPDKWISTFRAKGYGAFDGLLTISRNSISAHPYAEMEIIELPGY